MEFADVVRRRRMVRHFADSPVDRSVLERIASAAQRTPSAGFSQGQRLVIVTEPDRRRAVGVAVGESDYVEAGYDPWVSSCAAIFIPCVSEQVYHNRYREPDKVDDSGAEIEWPTPYWWMDVGCTVQMILLAAVDEGLAAGFAGAQDVEALRKAVGIPAEFHPVGAIPVGVPLPDKRSPSLKRGWRDIEDFVRWETWDR
ncbi:MAG: nitroreductase family protein [Chloroflexota bacterium]